MEKHDDAGLELVRIASEWKMHISAATIYDRVAVQLVDTWYKPSRSQGGVCTPRTTRSPEEGRVMRCWTWNTTSCSITEPLHWNHPKLNGWQMTEMAYLGLMLISKCCLSRPWFKSCLDTDPSEFDMMMENSNTVLDLFTFQLRGQIILFIRQNLPWWWQILTSMYKFRPNEICPLTKITYLPISLSRS